jgi:AcrR family transcriptional regulator
VIFNGVRGYERGVHGTRAKDRRVQKTRRLLLEALGSLLHEKRYDAIVVREILDRANVGRSTFYGHFRDKDELLRSAIREVVRSTVPDGPSPARCSERIVRFSGPMFEHIARHLHSGKGGMGFRSRGVVHERLRRELAERVTEELRNASRRGGPSRVPVELVAQYVTSTFVLVLNWWVESGNKMTPAQVDEVFRALVLPSLAEALGGATP